MECDKVKEYLPFLDDGSLPPDVEKKVRTHLEHCEECRREYDEQVNMLRLVQYAFPGREPEFSPEILTMVEVKIRKYREKRMLYRRVYAFAALVIITVGIAVYSLLPGSSNRSVATKAVFDDSLADYRNYVASRYLDAYELSELVTEQSETETQNMYETYISTHYFDVTPEDIIDNLDDNELASMLASN
ncbi:zf-HC2 domain-containing protein [bacterium]|nr:zf-HC2 domain-containing protein [bacterium]